MRSGLGPFVFNSYIVMKTMKTDIFQMGELRLSGARYLWLLAVFVFLIGFPVLMVEGVPLSDYPNHLARVFIWLVSDTPKAVPYFRLVWALQPNMAFDIFVSGVAQIVPLATAGRLFVMAALVSMAVGPAILGRALHGSFSWWSFLPFLFVYNRLFFWGFLGYLFALGLAIGSSALWVRYEPRNCFLYGYPVRAAVALIVLGSHLYAFGVLCLLATFLSLRELDFSGSGALVKDGVKSLFFKLIPLAFPLPLFLYFSPAFDLGHVIAWRGMGGKLVSIAGVLVGSSSVSDFIAAGVVSAVLLFLVVTRRIEISFVGWVFIVFLTVLHLAMPDQLFSSFGADRRLPIAIVLIACAFIFSGKALGLRSAVVVFMAFAVVLGVRLDGIIRQWRIADEIHQYQIDAYRQLAPQSSIIYLVGTKTPLGLPLAPLTEYAGYAVIERSVFWPGLFAYPVNGAQTIAFNPVEAGRSIHPGIQKIPLENFQDALTGKLAMGLFDNKSSSACFDFAVATREDGRGDLMPANSIFGPRVYANKFVSIYRIEKHGVCSWSKNSDGVSIN